MLDGRCASQHQPAGGWCRRIIRLLDAGCGQIFRRRFKGEVRVLLANARLSPFRCAASCHPLPADRALLLPAQALLSKVFERKKGPLARARPPYKTFFFWRAPVGASPKIFAGFMFRIDDFVVSCACPVACVQCRRSRLECAPALASRPAEGAWPEIVCRRCAVERELQSHQLSRRDRLSGSRARRCRRRVACGLCAVACRLSAGRPRRARSARAGRCAATRFARSAR